MMYSFVNRYHKNQSSHCFTVNEFNIEGDLDIGQLLSKNVFDNEIQPNHVRNENDGSYLRGLFNSNFLTENDFQYVEAEGIYYYLEGFSESEEEWGDDKPLFKTLLKEFKGIPESNIDGCLLINKEWFKKESNKVREREFTLYDYYFIIVWVDKNDNSKLYLSEWFSD